MDNKQAQELLKRYEHGLCTDQEVELLESWFLKLKSEQGPNDLSEAELEEDFNHVWLSLKQNYLEKRPVRLWQRLTVAAAVLLVIGGGLFYYNSYTSASNNKRDLLTDVQPGTNKAILTLSNGTRVALTDAANGKIAQQSGIQITKTADGQLIYTIQAIPPTTLPLSGGYAAGREGMNPNALNTIETPRGGQYQVCLPDGSHVWLNAATKLTYPVSFGKERKVQMSGEAYFEIAKDQAHPFIVKTNGQEVKVLGTHFNVSSYTDEHATKTTLLEGSVKIARETGQSVLLKPGEQAIGNSSGMRVIPADPETAVAWKNGVFVFKQESLGSLMRQISRWYDVDIRYTDDSSEKIILSGYISKLRKISVVLERVQSIGKVKFKIEGRNITVLPQT